MESNNVHVDESSPIRAKKKFYQRTTTTKLFSNLLGIHLSHAGQLNMPPEMQMSSLSQVVGEGNYVKVVHGKAMSAVREADGQEVAIKCMSNTRC